MLRKKNNNTKEKTIFNVINLTKYIMKLTFLLAWVGFWSRKQRRSNNKV